MLKKSIGKILLVFCLMLLIFPNMGASHLISNAIETGQATIIATKTNLYSSADFSSEKVTILDEDEQPVLITLKFNDIVTINEIQEDFAYVKTEQGVDGWIYKYYLSQTPSQAVYPVFNATIRKDTIIYDIDKANSGNLAMAGTRVYIFNGYDKKEDLTQVQIVLEDTSLFVGYIATEDLEPDGVSKMLIVAITVIAAAVTIILSLLYIKKKIKKKKKRKEKA